MDSSSPPHTSDVKAAVEPIVDKGTRLGCMVSALQELAPKETTVSTKPEKDPERGMEAAKGLGSLGKRKAVDTEDVTHELCPESLVRSGRCGPLGHSRTTAPGQREVAYPCKRSRTMYCSDGDDTYESASQVCSQKKNIPVNMTFRKASGTYIYGRQSIVNQSPDWPDDEEEQSGRSASG